MLRLLNAEFCVRVVFSAVERGLRCVCSVRVVFGCVRTCVNGVLTLRAPRAVCSARMNARSRVRQPAIQSVGHL
eukprot:9953455-Lingulodinium_polyedra.AAC.1